MKTPKLKHKRSPNEIELDDHSSTTDQLFLILSLDKAENFLNHLNNDKQLKLEIQNYLEESNLLLQRPNLPFDSFIKIDLFNKQNDQINSTIDLMNNHFTKLKLKISLWDSALINYFVECIQWSTTKWIHEFYNYQNNKFNSIEHKIHHSMFQSLFNINTTNNHNHNNINIEKLMCIIISFTMAYILLRHLQLWQLANKHLYNNQMEVNQTNENLIKTNKTTCLIGSIRFFKSLFQLSPTSNPINNDNNNNDEINLIQFEKQFSGYLFNLDSIAAKSLIEYFSKNFLNKHHLLEKVFGPYTAINQKLIKIPCPLYFDTLLETFETSTDSVWPAPLSEAIPLKFISKYSELFPEKVTKWLKIFKPDDIPKEIQQQQQQQQEQPEKQNEQSISSVKEIQIDEVKQEELDPMFKYLTSIDTLNLDELNAIIEVNPIELDGIIQKLLFELSINYSNKDYLNKIKQKQIELGKQLIDRAKVRITEWNDQNKSK
ncbi:unnamed protein product [Schistosoma guineensis]|nr:unnamed protein product [Schistosoma guineensis]